MNQPFKGEKGSLWEGGTRVPAFIHSPLLGSNTVHSNSDLIHVTDWYPSLVTLSGGSVKDMNLDGVDILTPIR